MSPTRLAAYATLLLAVPASADPPSGLGLMPSTAVGFVHVRAQDVYKHDIMKGFRDTLAAAGPKAVAAFDKQVYPSPALIDGVTGFLMLTEHGPQPVGVIAFTEALDTARVMKLHLPTATAEAVGNKTIYVEKGSDLVVYFPDLKHVAVSSMSGMAAFLSAKPGAAVAFAPAVKLAESKAVVAAVNVSALPIPPQAREEIPAEFRPLLAAERVTLTFDLSAADPKVEARLSYRNDKEVDDASAALVFGSKLARQQLATMKKEFENRLYEKQDGGPRPLGEAAELAGSLFAIGGLNQADTFLAKPPITKDGTDLTAGFTVPQSATGMFGVYGSGIGIGLLLPAVQKVREAAARAQGQNNLKQVGLAMHNYESAYGHLPTAAICDKAGKPLLSWRVAVLPFIEQENLYRQFKLDEPWDSETNKKLIPLMPKVYATPRFDAGEGKTVYKVFVGKGALFETNKKVNFVAITDGMSNTIMAVEGGEAVTWTKPDDIAFDPNKLPSLSLPNGVPMISVLMGDGSVRAVNAAGLQPNVLKALITRDGGEVVGIDDLTAPPKATTSRPAPAIKK